MRRAVQSAWRAAVRGGVVLALLGACSSDRQSVRPPPAAPRLDEAALAIPGDLDLVVRVDLERLRAALGDDVQSAIEHWLSSTPSDSADADAPTRRLLLELLARSKTAWVGVRPGLAPELTDNVFVLRGDFRDVLRADLRGDPPWGSPRDLGGGVFKVERHAPRLRVAPSVLYVRSPDVVVVGSEAEVDALERTIELGKGDPPLEAPDTGIVSLAARVQLLQARLRERSPTIAGLFEGAERLTASAGWTGTALDVRADLVFDSADRATAIAEALQAIARALSSSDRTWLGLARISSVEQFVSVRVAVPADELGRALRRGLEPQSSSGGTVGLP